MSAFYSPQGHEIGMYEWAEMYKERRGDPSWWRVGDDRLLAGRVSTVWLGLDHQHFDGPPLIFETMVFDAADGDERRWRYTTWAEAEAGHRRAVREVWWDGFARGLRERTAARFAGR